MKYPRANCLILVVAMLALVAWSALAQEVGPSKQPILRIETGMHTEMINRIGVDRAGRLLITASDDKTLRLWDVATGQLLRIFRGPIADGDEGKLYAVAISPDGSTIAVGGRTGYEWDLQNSIYLFETATGQMTRRIGGMPNVVDHLIFSPDGSYLAATLGTGGTRLFATSDGRVVGSDAGCDLNSYGVDFDPSGKRLVTSCYDGFIRLFAVETTGIRQLAKDKAPGGTEPFAVKFSPTGRQIAVGFADSTAVNVLSAGDLSFDFAPDTTGVDNGSLSTVAWSATGDKLFAAGRYTVSRRSPIRSWPNGGRGQATEVLVSRATLMDLRPLPDGGVVFGASDPAWGIVDRTGVLTRFTGSAIADYRNMLNAFRISHDGGEIGFGYEVLGGSPAIFSLAARRLEINKEVADLSPPITDTLNVTDWRMGQEPKFNGIKLGLLRYERSHSLAIAPDASRFLLGTDWYLRMFDRNGKEIWNKPTSGMAWSVNISGNGKLAVATLDDGTIRWYRMTDGQELLAFFPHNDKQRWVLWTPSGYFDASPGAEDLIGWHVNNGKDAAADFFPAALFREQFYRPDVIQKVLLTLDEGKAVEAANFAANIQRQQVDVSKQLPPIVEITSPREGSSTAVRTVKVAYSLRSASGEAVTDIKVLVDGQATGLKLPARLGSGEVTVEIPQRDVEISIIASNRFAPSNPASVAVKWTGEKPRGSTVVAEGQTIVKPKLYVLAIGVSVYDDRSLVLTFPAKDATDFANAVTKQKDRFYQDVVVRTLVDKDATKENIIEALDWIAQVTTADDRAMIFLAGHGINRLNRYYYLPKNYSADRVASTAIVGSEIENAVASIRGKVVLFVDTCRSGSVGDINGFVNGLSQAKNGIVVFTASVAGQAALESSEWNNGAFTLAVIEGLSGRAGSAAKPDITIAGLEEYVSDRVTSMTGGRQTPAVARPYTVPNFVLARR